VVLLIQIILNNSTAAGSYQTPPDYRGGFFLV